MYVNVFCTLPWDDFCWESVLYKFIELNWSDSRALAQILQVSQQYGVLKEGSWTSVGKVTRLVRPAVDQNYSFSSRPVPLTVSALKRSSCEPICGRVAVRFLLTLTSPTCCCWEEMQTIQKVFTLLPPPKSSDIICSELHPESKRHEKSRWVQSRVWSGLVWFTAADESSMSTSSFLISRCCCPRSKHNQQRSHSQNSLWGRLKWHSSFKG